MENKIIDLSKYDVRKYKGYEYYVSKSFATAGRTQSPRYHSIIFDGKECLYVQVAKERINNKIKAEMRSE